MMINPKKGYPFNKLSKSGKTGVWLLLGMALVISLLVSLILVGPVDSRPWFDSPIPTPGLYPEKYTPTPRPSPVLEFTFMTATPTPSATFPPTPMDTSNLLSTPAPALTQP